MLNIVIPMAGLGQRFVDAGYVAPKPLITVHGRPMIERVVENLNIPDARFIFIIRNYDYLKNLNTFLAKLANNVIVVELASPSEGAAQTVLAASDLINNDEPLIISNCDELLEWNSSEALTYHGDGCIFTTEASGPKWSYVHSEKGYVVEVAEKIQISNEATVGVYCWKRGSDFVAAAQRMIQNNERYNGEFYVAPVYNQAIRHGAKITTKRVHDFWSMGTPEDLDHTLKYCPLIADGN
jgi:dTDP-glucose pyrophosphorylase